MGWGVGEPPAGSIVLTPGIGEFGGLVKGGFVNDGNPVPTVGRVVCPNPVTFPGMPVSRTGPELGLGVELPLIPG